MTLHLSLDFFPVAIYILSLQASQIFRPSISDSVFPLITFHPAPHNCMKLALFCV